MSSLNFSASRASSIWTALLRRLERDPKPAPGAASRCASRIDRHLVIQRVCRLNRPCPPISLPVLVHEQRLHQAEDTDRGPELLNLVF